MLLDIPFQSAFFPSFTLTHSQLGMKNPCAFVVVALPFFVLPLEPSKGSAFPRRIHRKIPFIFAGWDFYTTGFSQALGVVKGVSAWQIHSLTVLHSISAPISTARRPSISQGPAQLPWSLHKKRFHFKHEQLEYEPGDRLNRATASEKLKMMWNFPSAFSRVPSRHSQRPLSNFPSAHTES